MFRVGTGRLKALLFKLRDLLPAALLNRGGEADRGVPRQRPGDATSAPLPADIDQVLRRWRSALIGVGLMSGAISLLYLTSSFFMLQVYDRVIPSRSLPTLVALAVLACVLYFFQGALDILRGRVVVRMAGSLDESLSPRILDLLIQMSPTVRAGGHDSQPLRDLDQIRGFLLGPGLTTFFDLPWIPIYIVLCFLFHPLIGWAVICGALVLIAVAILSEVYTRSPVREISLGFARRNSLAEAGRRNAEAVIAMGMTAGLCRQWERANAHYRFSHERASDIGRSLGSLSKALRTILQSGVLGLGAYLVIEGQATGGIIIASSILTARALSPVELAIANWRSFVSARQSRQRLTALLNSVSAPAEVLRLPPAKATLAVENISVSPPGSQRLVVEDLNLTLQAGQGLAVIGPSASGKSSLVRTLVGAWRPTRGTIRLDGADRDQWSTADLGRQTGYLPQDVELFSGTVGENIARFATGENDALVIEAAKAAGVHDLILRLPDGYATLIGEGGAALSAGQRQRIGLARALYGAPFLVVLDEPNSNLDQDGEQALTQAILDVRKRGGIAVVVAHRGTVITSVDQVLVLGDGRMQALGPKEEVLRRAPRPSALAVVGEAQAGRT